MCEQTPFEYKDGDIVWVKLRSYWWPGEVKDWASVPPELSTLKDKAVACVKFFEEDSYEIVKNINLIYLYNCKKKNDFIKKGLEMYRKNISFMKKFPGDVSAAEKKTGGSPDIIDSPMFAPQKSGYSTDIFGKTPTKSPSKGKRGRQSLKIPTITHTETSSSNVRRSLPAVTHPRFLGTDDHQIRILIQSPQKNKDKEPENQYTCPTCGFQTTRVDVIVLHNKNHIQGVYSTLTFSGKKGKRSPLKKTKKEQKSGYDTSDEDLFEDEDVDDEPKKKKRRKTLKPRKPRTPKKPATTTSNIPLDILEGWEDDDDENEDELDQSKDSIKDNEPPKDDANEIRKSCFDFEEEEDEDLNSVVLNKVRRSSSAENDKIEKVEEEKSDKKENKTLSNVIEENNELKTTKETLDKQKQSVTKNNDKEEINIAEKLETDVEKKKDENISIEKKPLRTFERRKKLNSSPEKESPQSSKVISDAANCHSVESKKETEQPSKSATDLEDTKQPKKENKKPAEPEKSEEAAPAASSTNVIPNFEEFEALMQSTVVPELPKISENLKPEQNFPLAKLKKIPDKDKDNSVSKTPSETVTKHTNPKKRIVKAFEDLEMEEKRRKSEKKEVKKDETAVIPSSEQNNSTDKLEVLSNNEKSTAATVKPSELEESKSNSELNVNVTADTEKPVDDSKGLKVLNLKSQLMTKLTENVDDTQSSVKSKYKRVEVQRAPRRSFKDSSIVDIAEGSSRTTRNDQKKAPNVKSITVKEREDVAQKEPGIKAVEVPVPEKPEPKPEQESNQECQVRKKIEIIPKNHGEVNITLTKVVENNNAKGTVPYKKYSFGRRQGRYALKFRSRVLYSDNNLDSSATSSTTTEQREKTPEGVNKEVETSENINKNVDTVVTLPTVEEIEFPKTSIQRTTVTTRRSMRNKNVAEDVKILESDVNKSEQKDNKEPLHSNGEETPSLSIVEEDVLLNNEKIIFGNEHTDIGKFEENNQVSHAEFNSNSSKDIEISAIVQETTTDCKSTPKSNKKESKYLRKSKYRKQTRNFRHQDDDDDETIESEVEKNVPPTTSDNLTSDKEEKKLEESQFFSSNGEKPVKEEKKLEESVTTPSSDEKLSSDEKPVENLEVQEPPEEFVDIMTVTPKKKKLFGKISSHIIQSIKPEEIIEQQEHVDTAPRLKEAVVVTEPMNVDDVSTTTNLVPDENVTINEEHKEHSNLQQEEKSKISSTPEETAIKENAEKETSKEIVQEVISEESSKGVALDEPGTCEDKSEVIIPPENDTNKKLDDKETNQKSDNKNVETEELNKNNNDLIIDDTIPAEIQEVVTLQTASKEIQKESEETKTPNENDIEKVDENVGKEEHVINENIEEVKDNLKEPLNVCVDNDNENNSNVFGDGILVVEKEEIVGNNSTENKTVVDKITKPERSVVEMTNVFVTTTNNEKEELSALSTLAAVSELSPLLQEQTTSIDKIKSIEANLTVVSQTDLENVQVEIVNAPESKAITLRNFSVDFMEGKEPQKLEKLTTKRCLESSNTEIPPEELPGVTSKESEKPTTLETLTKTDKEVENKPSLKTFNKENSVKVQEKTEGDQAMTSSKLLEILTDSCKSNSRPYDIPTNKNVIVTSPATTKVHNVISTKDNKIMPENKLLEVKNTKFIVKSTVPDKKFPLTKVAKPSILVDKVASPVPSETVSVQKVTSKRTHQDIEDIDAFIIQKPTKKLAVELSETPLKSQLPTSTPVIKKGVMAPRGRGKAKILQQTIITPAGDVIQPAVAQMQSQPEDTMFDINSMPIVLGDQILTPETIENMPVVITETAVSVPSRNTSQEKINTVKKTIPQQQQSKIVGKAPPTIIRTYASAQKLGKNQKNYQVTSSKVIKTAPPIVSQPNKQGKFIIVPSSAAGNSKAVVGKRVIGKQPSASSVIIPASASEIQEPVGNKIMIVTNQQGQQQRVLLTPAQQKMLGYQPSGTKLTKAALKSGLIAKSSKTTLAPVSQNSSNVIAQTAAVGTKTQIVSGNQSFITTSGQVLVPVGQGKQRLAKFDNTTKLGKKVPVTPATPKHRLQEVVKSDTVSPKTIVIKNQQGQIVKKIHGTDDALLDQQVQEQVEAIKASSSFSALKAQNKQQETPITKLTKSPVKRSYPKKIVGPETIQKPATTTVQQEVLPPLTPISTKSEQSAAKIVEESKSEQLPTTTATTEGTKAKEQRPLNQLIIQDALGNQTTITEGQILALPSETVDGQPQSYMLVTLDESGNLTPLNNEALLSLDPNLGIGGADLGNMVLQVDERGKGAMATSTTAATGAPEAKENTKTEPHKPDEQNGKADVAQPAKVEQVQQPAVTTTHTPINETGQVIGADENQTITCSVNTAGTNQQLIISGDPISTQKFIESLTEGNADLANLLASAEGNILIHTDGQQILINTESENSQLLLPVNAAGGNVAIESSEGGGNPIFATQSTKNQDILAAALADTDVFQQEQPMVQKSQLSPNSTLFPMNVGNVLETSLTLSSPIMTPLEIPSSNGKKIPDEESDILTTEVPKNVDLPITITDPNISQTVSNQQQVATLMATELQNNLDLPLSISDQTMSVGVTSEMNSPSQYVYSLPTLDDTVEMNQKTFSNPISMPLLNEESEISAVKTVSEEVEIAPPTSSDHEEKITEDNKKTVEENDRLSEDKGSRSRSPVRSSFMSSIEGGLCTLGGAMCSSLSEPPPDMFDLSSTFITTEESKKEDVVGNIPESNDDSQQHNFSEENNRFSTSSDEKPKRNNFLSEHSVLRNRSPVANIDENSTEIPLQPPIVAVIPDKEEGPQSTESSSADSEKSEVSSDSLVIEQDSVASSTENSSDENNTMRNSVSSISDSSKRKADEDLNLSDTIKKPKDD